MQLSLITDRSTAPEPIASCLRRLDNKRLELLDLQMSHGPEAERAKCKHQAEGVALAIRIVEHQLTIKEG